MPAQVLLKIALQLNLSLAHQTQIIDCHYLGVIKGLVEAMFFLMVVILIAVVRVVVDQCGRVQTHFDKGLLCVMYHSIMLLPSPKLMNVTRELMNATRELMNTTHEPMNTTCELTT